MIFDGKSEIIKILRRFLRKSIPLNEWRDIKRLIDIPPPDINYDYAFPVFKLTKYLNKDPQEIALEIENYFRNKEFLFEVKATGSYVNFKINPEKVLYNIFHYKEDYGRIRRIYGRQKNLAPQTIVIEYPSPNTNKPLHLGHIRNLLLGQTISNLLRYIGNDVKEVNLNNDRGIHICKSMLAYKNWGQGKEPDKKPDHFVGDFYTKYNLMAEKYDYLEEEAKDLLNLWELGDPNTINLWKKMRNWSLEGFNETYKKFNIHFDKIYNESDFYWKGKELILDYYQKGIFEKDETGAILARLNRKSRKKLPDKVLLRSNETSIYITQDIYLSYLKKKDFDYYKSIYVVGNEQNLYFKQLFAILKLINPKDKGNYHLSYGMISLPEGKMKSREGIVVEADEIIEKMERLAYEEVSKRYESLQKEEKIHRAQIIALSALRFFILKYNPRTDFVFNPDKSLSFEGETGPYIQYCYARINSIIEKSSEKIDFNNYINLLTDDKEKEIIKYLNYFPDLIENAKRKYRIHLIPQFLLKLCQIFNSFYSTNPVISENKELENARLLMIKCVQIVIKIGLDLLGIETLKEM